MQFSGGGDDGLACSAGGFYVFVEGVQVWAVAFGDQGALHQGGAGGLVAALCIIGLRHVRCDTKIGSQLAGFGEFVDIADRTQEHRRRERAYAPIMQLGQVMERDVRAHRHKAIYRRLGMANIFD